MKTDIVNRIGNAGCEILATLLQDSNCHLQIIIISFNDEGATTLANSLTNNSKLKRLDLSHNQIGRSAEGAFSRLLCNTSSISDIYASNQTLKLLQFSLCKGEQLARFI